MTTTGFWWCWRREKLHAKDLAKAPRKVHVEDLEEVLARDLEKELETHPDALLQDTV